MFTRFYTGKIEDLLMPNKVLVVYGPRQVGKTTSITEFLRSYVGKVYSSTGENAQLRDVLASHDFARIKTFFGGYDLIVIDEAQKIDDIGTALKIIVDQIDGIKVIATGSSSFDLSNKIGEPLVGRQRVITLFPLAVMELSAQFGGAYPQEHLEDFLRFGMYPEVLSASSISRKTEILTLLRDSYLYRDLIDLENLRDSKKILDLLRLIAFQIGKEVSLQELSKSLEMSKNTVERYLYLLEKAFVLINVRGFSLNLRKEVTKMSRYYFYDTGVRNAVIDNFNPLSSRDDVEQLWENFLFVERMKANTYNQRSAHYYFWRTWDQKEIDMIEDCGGKLHGYEFKWSPDKIPTVPQIWLQTYDNASYEVIHRDNFTPFVS